MLFKNLKRRKPNVRKHQLIKALRKLGLKPGMGVMVHSSLSSFGHLKGGAQTALEALMDILTPEGTLLLPSFNHGRAFTSKGPGYYDPRETPTANGAIPDLFWRLPGVLRSLNPTHPFAAWGKNAQRYITHHHRTLTMGPQSPLGLLCADGGYTLLLGVGYRSNTFHHVVETSTGAPCLGLRTEAYPVKLRDREVMGRTWGWRDGVCPHTDRGGYREAMRDIESVVQIGLCRATFFRLEECYAVIADLLKRGQAGYPPCARCPIRPRKIAQTVPSDWDSERQCLLPTSESLTY